MNHANLSYKLLEKYLDVAMNNGFIGNGGNIYKLTVSGRSFLEKYSQFDLKRLKLGETVEGLFSERRALERMLRRVSQEAKTIN